MRPAFISLTAMLLLAPAISVAQPAQTPAPAPAPAPAPTTENQRTTGAGGEVNTGAGIRSVDAKTLALTFYKMSPADFSSDNLVGANVYNVQNEEIGEVESLLIDEGKRISGVVLSVGGFLGIGERYVAIAPESLTITRPSGGELRAVVNARKEELEKAPEFKFEGNFARE